MDKTPTGDRIDDSHKRQQSHNLLPEELHKPSNFRWPLKAGNGENFVPNLTLFDGSHHDQAAPAHDGHKAWTVGKGETLYGKAEQALHAAGKPGAHYSPEQIRKEVVANAERNNWVKGSDAAASPEDKHRRAQFDAYLHDGKSSHLPKDLNGMVHKSQENQTKEPTKEPTKEAHEHSLDAPGKQPATDLNGRACAVQPKGDQLPVLENKPSRGCEFREPGDPKHPESKEIADLAAIGKASTVDIDVDMGRGKGGGKGSGVIIGKSDDGSKVYVATDNHVASPEVNRDGAPAKSREVTMPDGKHYPAQLAIKDPKNDRAVLSVDVGPGNADKYQAAAFSDNPGEKGKGVVLGFPRDSRSMYASPANLNGIAGSDEMFGGPGGLLKGEQRNRPQIDMPKTHTEEGVSGGPIFNQKGQVVGLLEGGMKVNPMTGKKEYWSYGNPTSRAEVDSWLAQIKAQAK